MYIFGKAHTCALSCLSESLPSVAGETVQNNVRLTNDGPFSPLKKIVKRFLFPRLSNPGDRWSDVLGFVPTGSVSRSSTLQIFRDAINSFVVVAWPTPVHPLSHSRRLQHPQDSASTGVLERGCRTLTHRIKTKLNNLVDVSSLINRKIFILYFILMLNPSIPSVLKA